MTDSFDDEEIEPLLVRAKRSILKKRKSQLDLVANEINYDVEDPVENIKNTNNVSCVIF